MKRLLLLATVSVAALALDCQIHMGKNENLKDVVTKCAKSNRTFEELWNMAPMSSESESKSSEEAPATIDTKMAFRSRRAAAQPNGTEEATTMAAPASGEEQTESCVVQCIFAKLEMVDAGGFPLHAKMTEGLLKHTPGRELRDFIQESTSECFQETNIDEYPEACQYSQRLVQCLAEKGKANCADWPIGDLPFQR